MALRIVLFLGFVCFFSQTSYADYSLDKAQCEEFAEGAKVVAELKQNGMTLNQAIDAALVSAERYGWTTEQATVVLFVINYVYEHGLPPAMMYRQTFKDCMKSRGHNQS